MNRYIQRSIQKLKVLLSYDDKTLFYRKSAILALVLILLPKLLPPIISWLPFGQAEPEPERPVVDVVQIRPESVQDLLRSSGTLRARYEVDLRSEVSGMITALNIREGARVSAGELLVQINDNDLQADLERVRANIAVMEQNVTRQTRLFERGAATQEDLDTARMQLNNLRAEMAAIEARIERTRVTAPFDGILGLKYVDVGSYITPQTRIASLRDMSSVFIDFSVPERYAGRIHTGSPVRFTVQGSDSLFTGKVHAVEPGIDPSSRTVNIRAVSSNEGGELRSGAFAHVELVLETHEEAVTVPSISLIPDRGAYKVFVVDEGVVHERGVEIGIRLEDRVQVKSGLEPGETVLVSGLLHVRDGMEVEIRSILEAPENHNSSGSFNSEQVAPDRLEQPAQPEQVEGTKMSELSEPHNPSGS